MSRHTARYRGFAALPVAQIAAGRWPAGPRTSEPFLFLMPPVPPRPLPARLSPRRLPLRMHTRLTLISINRWVTRGPRDQRLLALLVLTALIVSLTGLTVLEHYYPSDALGGAR